MFFSVMPLCLSIDILIPRLHPKQGQTRGVSLEMLSLQNVWINEGDVHLSHIHFSIINFFHPNDVINTKCVDRRCSVLFLYQHIEVVIACTKAFVKDIIVTECVDRGRRCLVLSLYPHINPD